MRRRSSHFKDQAWRSIFWVSLPPGLLFVLGSLFVTESPRWLFRRGKQEKAHAALLRSRSREQAALELEEMEATAHAASAQDRASRFAIRCCGASMSIPFLLACVILACNTATGVNSIIGYNAGILLQSGLSDLRAHWGYVIFTVGELSGDHDRHDAGGSQGAQVPAGDRHQRHHRRDGQRGHCCF